jgi:hypothetical protein
MSRGPAATDGGEGAEGIASAGVLRRLQLLAAAWALVLAAGFAMAGAGRRALVLTGGAVVSIVALRSLEGVVRRLSAAGQEPPPGLGWRYPLRLLLLVVLVSTLISVGRDPLALVLGVSAVPVAFLVEAALQLTALRREPAARDAVTPAEGAAGSAGRIERSAGESESEP